MELRLRTFFIALVTILVLVFLFIERAIIAPFVVAAIFAYLFNPVVDFFSHKIKLSRTTSVLIVYAILVLIVTIIGTQLSKQIFEESKELQNYATTLLTTTRAQINNLPDWVKPTVYDFLIAIEKSQTNVSLSLLPYFPKAIERLITFLIFIFSGYYFLRDGPSFIQFFVNLVPKKSRVEVEILLRKINTVLGSYLRGQIFLVLLMAMLTFVTLTILGIRFSLVLGIFSGFAEIVPIIGPIVAATLAALFALMTGVNNFGLTPINSALIVIAIYFILRHVEDYFVVPHIMGKITKLPPFIIFFSVIAGGHLWGVLGLILAVPTAAVLKILFEFLLAIVNKNQENVPGSE